MTPLEIWVGVECTVNRIGNRYFDQCDKSGHRRRLEDLELFAKLGAKSIRYPCVWESVAPDHPQNMHWEWLDVRLNELRRLGMNPIAGLLHHGSGPRYTSLIDEAFPEKFAAFAAAFARRYPWINDYTPINEPLTTARFCCLYGIWYPHLRDDFAWVKAMFLQTRATILAMQAIRNVNPKARLIQTEDLGRAQATEPLADQCRFENERRWLTFDLLLGRVNQAHPLYTFLSKAGLSTSELDWLVEHPCPPEILGVNHYPLSNRFLDHRLHLYPPALHGGNGRQRYADVGAIDSTHVDAPHPESVLREVWDRYQRPFAVTEVHVLGFRESQLAWFADILSAADRLRATGADLRAVTAWSLLGSYDWNSLCVADRGFYEPGVFDMRSERPRATALSKFITAVTSGKSPLEAKLSERPILITGASGTLGRAFAKICEQRGLPHCVLNRQQMDIADPTKVEWALDVIRPWAVINAAGYVKVDQAELETERCYRENTTGPLTLAKACGERGLRLITFSSDLVFDGEGTAPYRERDTTRPLNVYGMSKAEGERRVLQINPTSLVVRTSSFFGPWDEANFVTHTLRELRSKGEVHAPDDLLVSPTYVPDLVHACLDLLVDGEQGLLHLTNQGEISWAELARLCAKMAGLDPARVVGRRSDDFGYPARRPKRSALTSERMRIMPTLDHALHDYFANVKTAPQILKTEPLGEWR